MHVQLMNLFNFLLHDLFLFTLPGANPTIASYNASVEKIYSAVNSIARL
jgi:hypothetical protein